MTLEIYSEGGDDLRGDPPPAQSIGQFFATAEPDGQQPVGELLGQRSLLPRPQLLQCRRIQVSVGPQRQRGDVLGPEAYCCAVIQHHPLVTQPALRRAAAPHPPLPPPPPL